MLWHAIRAVCVPPVEFVFVVLAAGDRTFAGHDWSAFEGKLEPLFCGGPTRRGSVYNGLVPAVAAGGADDWGLVHHPARPGPPRGDVPQPIEETPMDRHGG